MNAVKTIFSIKDLENLSGIKAHTIRIWEKRYSILEPMRTDTNIRLYDIHNLQKLLNITLLHDYGYKISRISKLSPDKIPALVREIVSEKSAKSHAINAFKMAMMNFDQTLFINTYNNLLLEKSFRAVFYEVFIPLMNEIGLLWQSNTITIAHEHFITHLIKQKLVTNIEKIQVLEPTRTDTIFVLYLPSNEIHELGLMYLNYEFILSGYKTIYLGESVPIESLKDIQRYFDKITFVSYMTVQPTKDEINSYIEKIKTEILGENSSECWFIGKMTTEINPEILNKKTKIFQSIASIIEEI
ncbi:MerR family transcriptional regulator [Flavobacterium psychrophilum]|nr:MerR family transcriptional regulator [Flavobacterium psychrophilum]EKT4552180.1 MerR family transcriptional regulator [Flavobacterium psychrophilum]